MKSTAFDDTKTGVKSLVDAGVAEIPAIFRAPPVTLTSPKPPSSESLQFTIPTIDLEGGTDSAELGGDDRRRGGEMGFFNHGIPLEVLERMKDNTNKHCFARRGKRHQPRRLNLLFVMEPRLLGNRDDDFVLGIKHTRKSIRLYDALVDSKKSNRLYDDLYSSDMIIASPFGLLLASDKLI